jgi:hypothetical protein
MNDNSNQTALVASSALWRDRSLELREEEWQAHKDCLDAARDALKRIRGRKCTATDVTKLLDLASKLGRLATGMATEQVEHAWSQYHDPRFIAKIEAEIDKIFGKPINVESQALPDACSSRGNEALTPPCAVAPPHDAQTSGDGTPAQSPTFSPAGNFP